MLRIASIDIGKKNFSQYIQDTDIETLQKLKNEYRKLPKCLQRKTSGNMNKSVENILKQIFLSGTRIQTGVYDLRADKTSDVFDVETRKNIISHLNSFYDVWKTCDVILIEQQFFRTFNGRRRGGGSSANVDAIKIAEAVFTWFLIKFPDKELTYFSSTLKTQVLGAPYKLTKIQRKKWAEEKCKEIYQLRNDEMMINIFELSKDVKGKRMNSETKIQKYMEQFSDSTDDVKYLAEKIIREKQKLDDVSDTLVQCQAYIYKFLIACF